MTTKTRADQVSGGIFLIGLALLFYPGRYTFDLDTDQETVGATLCESAKEVLEGMTSFLVRTQGIDRDAASGMASEMMSKLPAWQ